jgi:hypothetical protein
MLETVASTAFRQHNTICKPVLHEHHPVGILKEEDQRSHVRVDRKRAPILDESAIM